MEKKIKPSDLDREAKRLIDSGQMPSLEQLLTAVAQVREKYRDQISAARAARHPKRRKARE
jgi:hypothetical protein